MAWLVEHLGIGPGAVVVDLAAGTGKLTRLLMPTGASVVAVEPVVSMGEVLREVLPSVPVVAGTAEAMPFRAASADAVCVAQAALVRCRPHVRRAGPGLRPGGRVGLAWDVRDRSVDWVDRVWRIMDAVERHAPWRDHDNTPDAALHDTTSAPPRASSTARGA